MRSYRGLRGGDGGGEEGGGDSDRGFKGRKKISAFDKQLADAQKVAEEEEKALEEVRGRTFVVGSLVIPFTMSCCYSPKLTQTLAPENNSAVWPSLN